MGGNARGSLFSLREVARAVGGELVGGPGEGIKAEAVTIDSRKVPASSLFFALAGEHADGHDYIEQALRSGAVAFVASRAADAARFGAPVGLAVRLGRPCILVDDTLRSLQALAAWHLGRYPGLTRIAVTGSNGKTTTKELIGAVLSGWRRTAVSPGNLNSETGLPLSCFRVGPQTEIAVFELAMNHLGEIRALADIVRPDHALITNIGVAHIGFCGSQEAIAREKKAIFAFFTGDETAYLPAADRYYPVLADGVRGRIVPFGPGATRGFEKSEARGLDGSVIHWEGLRLRLPLVGRHNVLNALAAISVASELGVPSEQVRRALEAASTLPGRSQVLRGRVTVIADFYNSSPESAAELIHLLGELGGKGRRIGVFGSMLELGDDTAREHERLGVAVAGLGLDAVLFHGDEARLAYEAAKRVSPTLAAHWTASHDELGRLLSALVRDGDLVALKGSRGVELERVLPVLLPEAAARTHEGVPCS